MSGRGRMKGKDGKTGGWEREGHDWGKTTKEKGKYTAALEV